MLQLYVLALWQHHELACWCLFHAWSNYILYAPTIWVSVQQVTEANWLTRVHDSRCAEASKIQLPSFVSVGIVGNYLCWRLTAFKATESDFCYFSLGGDSFLTSQLYLYMGLVDCWWSPLTIGVKRSRRLKGPGQDGSWNLTLVGDLILKHHCMCKKILVGDTRNHWTQVLL
jgi:hypothetical protein